MGQEISATRFDQEAFAEFQRRLARETALLGEMCRDGGVRSERRRVGLELEGWLVDGAARPAPRNSEFLATLHDDCVVPELAQFNFELNSRPQDLACNAFERLHSELQDRWKRCQDAAESLGLRALMIGILPTVAAGDLSLRNISTLQRYRALNEQVLRLRGGAPLHLSIDGRDSLRHEHGDLMLESAATSFQLHLQLDIGEIGRAFNIAKMISAPVVAATGNSPFLFGRQLWEETRIPLFEQAVAVGHTDYSKRVTFGVRYVEKDILECFEANRDRYPVLLPELNDGPEERLPHLRLHNGTIWRWNRPLIGFDDDGAPHFRLEHRVIAAGPTPLDVVANGAFVTGLLVALLEAGPGLEQRLPFDDARANFYQAAREGLAARIRWLDGREGRVDELLSSSLLDMAREGLQRSGLTSADARRWIEPVERRVLSGQTGAAWQRQWVAHHGEDFAALVDAYHEQQESRSCVAGWTLDD